MIPFEYLEYAQQVFSVEKKKRMSVIFLVIVFTAKGKLNSSPCRSDSELLIMRECAFNLRKWVKGRIRYVVEMAKNMK